MGSSPASSVPFIGDGCRRIVRARAPMSPDSHWQHRPQTTQCGHSQRRTLYNRITPRQRCLWENSHRISIGLSPGPSTISPVTDLPTRQVDGRGEARMSGSEHDAPRHSFHGAFTGRGDTPLGPYDEPMAIPPPPLEAAHAGAAADWFPPSRSHRV